MIAYSSPSCLFYAARHPHSGPKCALTSLLLELTQSCLSSCFTLINEPCWKLHTGEATHFDALHVPLTSHSSQIYEHGQQDFCRSAVCLSDMVASPYLLSIELARKEPEGTQPTSMTWLPCVGRYCDSKMTLRGCSFECTCA